ncbi:uncharacterized protein PITG_09625 [Phytophthora infestans T30-4]|uniref:RED-like N-terminal domain-containing protein n=1 Tax=Phytophthora infestans (strain T30-4) TaxID=403677 RepID=D0NCF4_PHYIT|nr:uncharacterized protein PITG_09625 [Phytophthora infestans T30-4]EEY55668.1 conserved hypothetical protein [Phytophthora infestans T30-4]|eukprot:XP_002903244.1 conserved hypothetical protein [Phytophthora infestans T30-4]
MNQDDFRQMLASGEASEAKRSYGGKRNLSEADLSEIKKLSTKKAKKKSKKPTNATPADAAGPRPPNSQYRDRAAERRRGETGDMIDAEEYKHLDTEQSKFLGGDMEHTHLVKGLDFALLSQLKREKQKLLAEKQKQMAFKTRMGRLVYFHACQSTPESTTSVKSELFLPGRMYYTFNLSPTELESVPVSVQRSKEDCPEPDEVVSGTVNESLIDRVAELMSSKKNGKKMRKKKKRDSPIHHSDKQEIDGVEEEQNDVEMPETEVEAAVDEDEDIFPDVGDYVPMDQRTDDESAGESTKEAVKKAGYFSNLSAAITEKEEAARKKEEDAEREWKETLQKAVETQKKMEREKERREKAAKMTGGADDYAEYQGTARRRKAAGLSGRKDIVDSDEKTRRKKQKQSNKLANDLEKINKVRLY